MRITLSTIILIILSYGLYSQQVPLIFESFHTTVDESYLSQVEDSLTQKLFVKDGSPAILSESNNGLAQIKEWFILVRDNYSKNAEEDKDKLRTQLLSSVDFSDPQKEDLVKSLIKEKSFSLEIERVKEDLAKYEDLFQNEIDKYDFYRRTAVSKDKKLKWNSVFNKGGFITKSTDSQLFYEGLLEDTSLRVLKNTNLSFNNSGGTTALQNEIIADYFGAIRFGIGVLVTAETNMDSMTTQEETVNDATQRLLGGGGNAILTLGYPWLDASSKKFRIASYLSPKLGVDIPQLNSTTSEVVINADLGLQTTVYLTGFLGNITLYGNHRLGRLFGSDMWHLNLGQEEADAFTHNQFTLGIAFNSAFRISYTWNGVSGTSTNNGIELPSTLSFAVIPQ